MELKLFVFSTFFHQISVHDLFNDYTKVRHQSCSSIIDVIVVGFYPGYAYLENDRIFRIDFNYAGQTPC